MSLTITYYLDVTSSWCYWAEPAWAELQKLYTGRPVRFSWKISMLPSSALPKSRAQCDWFYRRSGTIVRSPFMLNSGWFEEQISEYLAPNLLAEAAKEFGVTDDRVRLALAEAALRDGLQIGQWQVAGPIAAKAAGVATASLVLKAKAPEIDQRIRASTAEFQSFQMTQRPAFLLENNIGDRAVFSGLATTAPLAAAIDAMLVDAAAYESYTVHYSASPPD